jgi:hypothetical protein
MTTGLPLPEDVVRLLRNGGKRREQRQSYWAWVVRETGVD